MVHYGSVVFKPRGNSSNASRCGCTYAVIFTVDNDIGILACYAMKLELHLMVLIGTGSQIIIIYVE